MLYSQGFETSKALSRKIVCLLKCSSEQLSRQCHYDFGLRTVKTMVMEAGTMKRNNPDINENMVIIKTLHNCTMSKLTKNDAVLYKVSLFLIPTFL